MLVTDKLVYIHIPKTAGHFAKRYIKKFAGSLLYEGEWHGPLSRLPEEYSQLPIVSFVRNPWDWYVSWFFHQKDIGFVNPLVGAAAASGIVEFGPAIRFIVKSTREGTKESKLLTRYVNSAAYKKLIKEKSLKEPGLQDLNSEMIKNLTQNKIGMLTWRYQFLLGAGAESRCIFGRYENLAIDLIDIFCQLGVVLKDADKEEIILGKPMNKGMSRFNRGYQSFYDTALINLIGKREQEIIKIFGYTFD